MSTNPRHHWTLRWLALAGLLAALASPQAWAVGGGSPDPSTTPVLQALEMQVDDLDRRFLALTGIIEPEDLPRLKQLADELVRIDAHLALAAVGGGSPDPNDTTLNQALLDLRWQAAKLRLHVAGALKAASGHPTLEQITVTRTLRFMQAATRMLIARIDYALPATMVPPATDL